MKCLTIRQPWAALIMLGVKKVENRSWNTRYRGTLLIHAAACKPEGKSWSDVLPRGLARVWSKLPALETLPRGVILGSVEVYDCLDEADLPSSWDADPFVGGPWCWLLRDPRPLATPVPCRGSLSLWTPPAGLKLA